MKNKVRQTKLLQQTSPIIQKGETISPSAQERRLAHLLARDDFRVELGKLHARGAGSQYGAGNEEKKEEDGDERRRHRVIARNKRLVGRRST